MGFLPVLPCFLICLIMLSFSKDIDCDYHCQDGPTVKSTDCYVVVGCDLSFPSISLSYEYRYIFRLDLNFTELATDDAVPRAPFLYSGMFWYYEDHNYDRYLFKAENLYCNYRHYCYNFYFSILNIQLHDAGTYQVDVKSTNSDSTAGPIVMQHTYRLFVYQPSTPLVCQGPSSSPSGSYHVTISCSITNGFPPINLEMIEPEGCDFQKHYTDENGIQELSVGITSCDQNSTVGCIAIQETMASLSTPQYSDRCEFNISKSNPVYQPPTPLVCEGPSSSPSASYHVVLSCSITGGYPPINLEVIKPEGCDYQKYYTDNNGTKELSVYVTSCDKNSIVGCIATHEPLESLSTSQYDDRCEFNISRTDQDTKNIMTLLMIVIAVILVVSVIAIVYVYRNRERAKTDNSTVEMTDTTRGGSISRQSISHRTLPNIPVRPDLPKIPSDGNVSDGSNESENYYITTDESPKQRGVFGDKDICFIMNIKLDQWHSRWMGTIPANKGTKKCVVLTTVTDEAFRRKDIHWDEFVKRTLDLPVTKYLVKVEGIGILKAKLHLVQEHFACETLDSWLVKVFSQETFENTMYLSEVMGIIAGLLEGLNLIHSYGFLHPGLSSKKILRIEKGQCKLYDFCLSDDASKITTFRKTKVPYSLNHFPPEALHRNEYSQPSDVWAAAGVIWEVITGQLPFPWSEDGPTFEEQCGAPSESQVTHYEEIRNKQLYQCWHQVCPQRPTIRELRESYQEIFEKLADNTYEIPRMDLYTSMKSSTIHNKDGGEVYTDTYTAVP